MKKILNSLNISALLLFLSVKTAFAVNIQNEFKSPVNQASDVSKLVGSLLANSNIIAGIFFLILVITAGYRMLNHAGDVQKFATGKDVITYALLGFLIIFAAYWIIQIVETMTGFKIIS